MTPTLTITNTTITGEQRRRLRGTSAPPGRSLTPVEPNTTSGARSRRTRTCAVNVGFKPTVTSRKSVAYLTFTSNADDATERVLLNGQSTDQAQYPGRRQRSDRCSA